MSEPRRFLVALAGTEDVSLSDQVAQVIGAADADVEVTLLHVEDTGPRELAARDPMIRRGPWPHRSESVVQQRLTAADDQEAAALLVAWQERFAAALPGAGIAHLIVPGRPEQEIVAAAARLKSDALILCPRPRSGASEPGPRSVGHVARFVLDHSPVPVLLIRRSR
jgi:nucleotide-binding universal stress UspA family protein